MTTSNLRRVVLATALATAANAQRTVPTIVLDKGASEISDPFTRIGGMVELRDGRVLASELQEKEVWLVDFARSTRTQVARAGGGPTEIQLGTMVPGASDSAVYNDMQQRRLLIFSPSGVPVFTRSSGGDRNDPMAALSAMQPRYIDASGRILGQTTGMTMPSAKTASTNPNDMMPTFADSVVIVRLDPASGRTDTVARIRNMTARSRRK
jgi:hypothetical protein